MDLLCICIAAHLTWHKIVSWSAGKLRSHCCMHKLQPFRYKSFVSFTGKIVPGDIKSNFGLPNFIWKKKSTPGVLRLYLRQKPGRIGASSKILKDNRRIAAVWLGFKVACPLHISRIWEVFSKSKHFRQLFDFVFYLSARTSKATLRQTKIRPFLLLAKKGTHNRKKHQQLNKLTLHWYFVSTLIAKSSRNHGDFGQETTEQWKQKAACLGYVEDCTLQFCWDENKSFKHPYQTAISWLKWILRRQEVDLRPKLPSISSKALQPRLASYPKMGHLELKPQQVNQKYPKNKMKLEKILQFFDSSKWEYATELCLTKIHLWKLTWKPENEGLEDDFLFKQVIFSFHVDLSLHNDAGSFAELVEAQWVYAQRVALPSHPAPSRVRNAQWHQPFAKHHAFNSSRVASLCIIFTLEESSVTAFTIKTVPRYYHLTT